MSTWESSRIDRVSSHCRRWLSLLALLALPLVAVGCHSRNKDWDTVPFSQMSNVPKSYADRTAAASGVTQAGFQQPGPAAGASIGELSADEEKRRKRKRDDDDDNDGLDWSDFKPSNINKRFMKLIGKGPNEDVARKAYAEGDIQFRAGNFKEAAKQYKIASKRWPDSSLQEDAMYMWAESCFFGDRYYKANDVYTDLLKKYDNSRHLDRVVVRYFSIARYWEEQSEKHLAFIPNFSDKTRPYLDLNGNAIACYEAIRLNDPTGPLADDALFLEANNYYRRARYEDADYHYDLLRKEYPSSQHQVAGHLLGLRAKLRTYQGPQYEERPLKESDKLIDVTLAQFTSEIPEERERLIRAKSAIRAEQAQREWINGEYYYKRKYYRAARYYYDLVLKKFPETSFAEMAQKRMDETKDYPPVPKDYWAWLGKIFGERDRRRD